MNKRIFAIAGIGSVMALSLLLGVQTSYTLSYIDGNVAAGQANNAYVLPHAGKVLGASTTTNSGDSPASVIIIVNDATPPEAGTNGVGASDWVGEHYAAARGIPTSNIFHINWSPCCNIVDPHNYSDYTISSTDYISVIRDPLRAFLQANSLTNAINYIVPVYGVPFKFNDSGALAGVSLDSFLTYLNSGSMTPELVNPYQATAASDFSEPTFVISKIHKVSKYT